jgi:hypothetical protein
MYVGLLHSSLHIMICIENCSTKTVTWLLVQALLDYWNVTDLYFVCVYAQVSYDGQFILCQCKGVINIVNSSTGVIARSLQHVSLVIYL